MADWNKRIDYGRYYYIISIKTPNTLATLSAIAVTIFTSAVLGLSPVVYSVVMFAGILVLYSVAIFIIGILNYKKNINIPLLITSNIPPLEALKESMKRYKYTPWRINVLKREFGPSAFREEKLTTVEIPAQLINCSDDLLAIARTLREKIHIIGKELIGLNSVRFHLYITQETPTTIAFIVGVLLGDEHANFTTYTGGTQNRIEKILDSEDISKTTIDENQLLDTSKFGFVTDIYNKAGKLEKENLSLEDTLEIVRTGFGNFILLVDLTPSPVNRISIVNFLSNVSGDCDGFIVATIKSKSGGLFGLDELQYLSMHFSDNITEIVEKGLNGGGRIALALKVPHPFSIVIGYKLRHQTDLEILHYSRREGEYVKPILLKNIFAT